MANHQEECGLAKYEAVGVNKTAGEVAGVVTAPMGWNAG